MLGVNANQIRWYEQDASGCTVLRPSGELSVATAGIVSGDLVKFALNEPRAVIVIIDGLGIASEALFSAFTLAWMRVGDWPAVPIALVAGSEALRRRLHANAVDRFLPVTATVAEAQQAVGKAPQRRRICLDMPLAADCGRRARRFTEQICERWEVPEVCDDAQLVATEFIENAFLHTRFDADISFRLELRQQLLTVAVADQDPREAVLPEAVPGRSVPSGLHMVARMARAWGCSPQWPVGKVVWATLPTGTGR
ncbi:hypothetical protein [Nocardia pseudobrasiliensis]|uniref:Anti-sigma regulatory factor (Ser/Thr protein kinase) n=1 Tax=Nocardia pseudobrasiliensis TaxID=45979 RepID=A0A370IB77_9NOCA|nr:hypothetical protein [Nocardia pseudobrasiliensis]RDI67985.1 hypothetical protein DFR76_102386 [Nocardia pseudobrasiliensis]